MKYNFLFLMLFLFFTSCEKKGNVRDLNLKVIIQGKSYHVVDLTLFEGGRYITLLIPDDSITKVPIVVKQSPENKSKEETTIIIK